MQKVIFDSSFLMAVAETPTSWLEDITYNIGNFEPVLLDCVRDELAAIAGAGQAAKRAKLARVALELAREFKVGTCSESSVDDEIASAALTWQAAVATTDASLARLLRQQRVRVVSLKAGRVSTT